MVDFKSPAAANAGLGAGSQTVPVVNQSVPRAPQPGGTAAPEAPHPGSVGAHVNDVYVSPADGGPTAAKE